VITRQVANGVAVRMAVLFLLLASMSEASADGGASASEPDVDGSGAQPQGSRVA